MGFTGNYGTQLAGLCIFVVHNYSHFYLGLIFVFCTSIHYLPMNNFCITIFYLMT